MQPDSFFLEKKSSIYSNIVYTDLVYRHNPRTSKRKGGWGGVGGNKWSIQENICKHKGHLTLFRLGGGEGAESARADLNFL